MGELVFIALGSNLGERAAHLAFARERIARFPSTRILAVSDVEETAPLGGRAQPAFLNQMIAIATALTPGELLWRLQTIERERGRVPSERWASRTLDLDIVMYDEQPSSSAELTLPHPGLADRDFWQRELAALRAQLPPRG